MELSTLLEKIQEMAQSSVPVFSVAGFTVTEQHVIYLAVTILALALLLLLQTILRPIVERLTRGLRISHQEKKIAREVSAEEAVSVVKIAPTTAAAVPKSDETSLVDTSDRKRSLYDFVTPDTIHAEVMKQTLNDDYPYQNLVAAVKEQPVVSPPTQVEEKPLSAVEFPQPAPLQSQKPTQVPPTLPPLPGKPQPISPQPIPVPKTTATGLNLDAPVLQQAVNAAAPAVTTNPTEAQPAPVISPAPTQPAVAQPPITIAAPALPNAEVVTTPQPVPVTVAQVVLPQPATPVVTPVPQTLPVIEPTNTPSVSVPVQAQNAAVGPSVVQPSAQQPIEPKGIEQPAPITTTTDSMPQQAPEVVLTPGQQLNSQQPQKVVSKGYSPTDPLLP